MRVTRAGVAALVSLSLAAMLAGCGGGDDSPSSTAPTQQPSAGFNDGPDAIARGPMTVHGATEGGTLTVLTQAGLRGSLDPAQVHAPDLLSIDRGLLTRSLTQYR